MLRLLSFQLALGEHPKRAHLNVQNLTEFLDYCQKYILQGDEKGEAQSFLEAFFMGLGHKDGVKGAGAVFEERIKSSKNTTGFGDLVWKKRVLIEMKKRGKGLAVHIQQAEAYWRNLLSDRPRYIILCNFDEFWIYDTDRDMDKPVDVIKLEDVPNRKEAFAFLLPIEKKPIFRSDQEDVTYETSQMVSSVYKGLVSRGVVSKEDALHYILQCVVAMFAEDVNLLPDKIFTRLIEECLGSEEKSYDLIGGLFREMNYEGIAPTGSIYEGVDYFNGGLFAQIKPITLERREIELLDYSARKDWKKVNPAIFGTFFENNLEADQRHKTGAHYTREMDIKKIVQPCIVEPWLKRIEEASTIEDYFKLLNELTQFKVLDPACGSGNFLFVAFKEIKLLERTLFDLLWEETEGTDRKQLVAFMETYPFVNTSQFYGMDLNPTAVEIAKVTLMVAKELSILDEEVQRLYNDKFKPLPLDNLDGNIRCVDALLDEQGNQRKWPEVDVIIGNPPFQSKNKMQKEFGAEYVNKLRKAYPEVPGRADFCVYWYYRAHQHLKEGSYAGLVGTNTIRQNYSREGSLDYIVNNGGEIFDAVSTQKWSGAAVVHVSIVNWFKGAYKGERALYVESAEGEPERHVVDRIGPSLSHRPDVTNAEKLTCNLHPKSVFQGQTHGHEGFLLPRGEAKALLKKDASYNEVVKPFLTGDELLSSVDSQPSRFVTDFTLQDQLEASSYKEPFKIIQQKVLPERRRKAEEQEEVNAKLLEEDKKAHVNKHHINFYNNWWKLSWGREDLLDKLKTQRRFVVCSQVLTPPPVFEFVSTEIRPNAALIVFPFEDYYSFGVIHSIAHSEWFKAKCSTMKGDWRYTSESVWATFPWPQSPTKAQVDMVAQAAQDLHLARTKALKDYNKTLRDLYRLLEQPGKNPIKDLHAALDKAVLEAYGFDQQTDLLSQLLDLNFKVAAREAKGEPVQGPGLPSFITDPSPYVTDDCVKFSW